MFCVMVVEDDKELRDLFCTVLSENGYDVLCAENGEQALVLLEHSFVNLIISDIMMPRLDDYALTKALRDAGFTLPILMITAKNQMADKQAGFQAGTDDYMIKPIDVNEMLWRAAALLRRAQSVSDRRLQVGGTVLDCDALSVSCGESKAVLPQKEFFLLFKLLSTPDRIFTKRQIIDEIWGLDFDGDPHTLEVHISRLRERFKDNCDFEIVTIRGLGYKAVKKS